MNRIGKILEHPEFIESIEKTARFEQDREFCGHGMEHLFAVARIAHILNLEDGINAAKEHVYAAALLHDIGRWRQYEDDTPHEEESARIAARILPDCEFSKDETLLILDAILSHRTRAGEKPAFSGLLYRADKLSRLCFECAARDGCNWTMKNTRLEY